MKINQKNKNCDQIQVVFSLDRLKTKSGWRRILICNVLHSVLEIIFIIPEQICKNFMKRYKKVMDSPLANL